MSTARDLDELVEEWTLAGFKPIGGGTDEDSTHLGHIRQDTSFTQLLHQLEYFSEKFFSRYIPALFPPHPPSYHDRLVSWLNNEGLKAEQQRLLFEFALKIAFFSFEDFLQLYRTAFVGPVTRWIIDELGLSLEQSDFQLRLQEERTQHTWYCPVTDSMVISEFYHGNGIAGIDQRPAFRPLREFCEPSSLTSYMACRGLKRLVLMEDFVGSGTQCIDIVRWATQELSCPVLFVPLVICPDGTKAFTDLASAFASRLRFEPVLPLDASAFVAPEGGTKDALLSRIADLATSIHSTIAGTPDTSYGRFGFSKPGDRTKGAAVVLFSNTPDNSLPLIHHHARPPSNWKALFPRVSRETP
jgi:hypothetical protein